MRVQTGKIRFGLASVEVSPGRVAVSGTLSAVAVAVSVAVTPSLAFSLALSLAGSFALALSIAFALVVGPAGQTYSRSRPRS